MEKLSSAISYVRMLFINIMECENRLKLPLATDIYDLESEQLQE